MKTFKNRNYNLTIIVLVLMTFTPLSLISASTQAATIDSKMIAPEEYGSTLREIDEVKIKRALENKIVAEKLLGHGLTKEEVINKMEHMSDEQVHQIASLSDKIPAGGDSGLAIIVTILVIVALVLVILYLYKRV